MEIDPSHILKSGDFLYYHGEKYQKVEAPKSFYNKLWDLLKTKLNDTVDCDELTDRIMDLIKDHNPEPTDEEIGDWGDYIFLPSLSKAEKLSFPITDKDLRIIVRAALAHWK
jgi:hypothetical protein